MSRDIFDRWWKDQRGFYSGDAEKNFAWVVWQAARHSMKRAALDECYKPARTTNGNVAERIAKLEP